jgi:hypothetical protein
MACDVHVIFLNQAQPKTQQQKPAFLLVGEAMGRIGQSIAAAHLLKMEKQIWSRAYEER